MEEKEIYRIHQKDATNSEFYTVRKSDGKVSNHLQVHDMPVGEEQYQKLDW